jgi:hypothetical protein
VIDKTEVEQLLKVNHSINQNNENCPEWSIFFAASISRLIIFDMNLPGEIDSEKGDWIASMLHPYSLGSKSEKQLLIEAGRLRSNDKVAPSQPASIGSRQNQTEWGR